MGESNPLIILGADHRRSVVCGRWLDADFVGGVVAVYRSGKSLSLLGSFGDGAIFRDVIT